MFPVLCVNVHMPLEGAVGHLLYSVFYLVQLCPSDPILSVMPFSCLLYLMQASTKIKFLSFGNRIVLCTFL